VAEFLRLYLDECVHAQAAQAFRSIEIDAIGAHELGNFRLSDDEQLEFAVSENRVLVTYNACHFVPMHEEWMASGKEHSGILLSPRDYKPRL
jgi:predicted nuclease of predicted toxin-antitoxin system